MLTNEERGYNGTTEGSKEEKQGLGLSKKSKKQSKGNQRIAETVCGTVGDSKKASERRRHLALVSN